jgi:hypothetical protein
VRFVIFPLIPLLMVFIFIFWVALIERDSQPEPKSREYRREFTAISLRKQRQDQLDDWERRFRLSMSHEEYVLTLFEIPEGVCLDDCRPKLHQLSAGVADGQVRR